MSKPQTDPRPKPEPQPMALDLLQIALTRSVALTEALEDLAEHLTLEGRQREAGSAPLFSGSLPDCLETRKPTLLDARTAIELVIEKHSVAAAESILAGFAATKVAELKQSQCAEVIEACRQWIVEHQPAVV